MKRMGNLPGPAQQLDLFGDDRPSTIVDTPAWPELPAETRATLTGLMARLILEHADGSRAGLLRDRWDEKRASIRMRNCRRMRDERRA
jgi:hypothetical protein